MTSDLLSPYVDRAREILGRKCPVPLTREIREEIAQAIAYELVAERIAALRYAADCVVRHLDAVLALASSEQGLRTEAETLAAAVREDEDGE